MIPNTAEYFQIMTDADHNPAQQFAKKNNINVLLVYPKTPDTFWSMKHAISFIGKRATEPPLGLITVAAMLPRGWNRKLVDTNVTDLTDAAIRWSDLVFLSGMDLHRASFEEIAARCKHLGATVVGGGPFCSMHHEEIEHIDHFVLNEAELTLPAFISDFETGNPKRLYYSDLSSDQYPDLATTPIPQWNLLDLDAYATMDVQYSRGCPFDCEFCSITSMFGHKPRCKATHQLIDELESLYGSGWRGSVFIVDDNFIGDRRKLKEDLLPALTRWCANRRYPFTFTTEVSVNLANDEDLADAMILAGFRTLFVGIETPDEMSLRECGKVQNVGNDLKESVKFLQRKGFDVTAGFIVGFDNDSPNVFDRQIAFIQQSGIVTAMVGILMAETGTKLYKRLEQEGRIEQVTSGNNTDGELNFVPVLDPDLLRRGYRRIVRTIYSPKQYFNRVKTFLSEYRMPKTGPKSRDKWNIGALFKAVWRIGVVGKGRGYFWLLMLHVVGKYPSAFAAVMRMAIYGFHFRKVAEQLGGVSEAIESSQGIGTPDAAIGLAATGLISSSSSPAPR